MVAHGRICTVIRVNIPSHFRVESSYIWKQWSAHRRQTCSSYSEWPIHLMIAQPMELDHWLSRFVLETRKSDGEHYSPDTLYGICTGLLRYIRETRPEINIFKDPVFVGFQKTLDSEMKRLRTLGLGAKKKWDMGLLGDSNPRSLLDTMLFLCGIHFAVKNIVVFKCRSLSYILRRMVQLPLASSILRSILKTIKAAYSIGRLNQNL